MLLINTVRLVPSMIGPSGGSGMGGIGGGPLGGCLTWAWGIPRANPVKVAAGKGPSALARPLTSCDIFSSAAPPKAPAMAEPGSATMLVMDAAFAAAALKAWAAASAFLSPAAMACLTSGGGTGSVGRSGGVAGLTASLSELGVSNLGLAGPVGPG